jgi:CRP/FNR family cyclic AMP-dependent transcriptional regulator
MAKRKRTFDVDAFLTTVNGGRTISRYREDQVVYSQGDAADSVFYVQSGKVKVTVVSKQGKEAVVTILGEGAFVGEGCLTGQPRRLATAVAMTECVSCGWRRPPSCACSAGSRRFRNGSCCIC